MNGIINVYKPLGMTSHDVVSHLRGLFKLKRIGHTGTLDPNAAGVLPVCIGKATKIVEYLTNKRKKYRTELILGVSTDTLDATGNIISQKDVNVTKDYINEVISSFVGKIEQIPPMYSAVKINGKKLYQYARQGIEIDRPSREIEIYSIDILEYDEQFKKIKLDIECSKGTYIRTLCSDIGDKLGCGAHMSTLIRLQSGLFSIENSVTLEQIKDYYNDGKIKDFLIPIDFLFSDLPKVTIKPESMKWLLNGAEIFEKDILEKYNFGQNDLVRVYNTGEEFLALYKACDVSRKKLCTDKIFI